MESGLNKGKKKSVIKKYHGVSLQLRSLMKKKISGFLDREQNHDELTREA